MRPSLLAAGSLLVALSLSIASPGRAQDATGTSTAAPTATATAAPSGFIPPVALVDAFVPVPDGAVLTSSVSASVRIRVDERGEVIRVELTQSAGPLLDEALLTGATNFRFQPARFDGQPVMVDINFTQTFEPPPPVLAELAPDTGVLELRLEERGTRRPLPFATVVTVVGETRTLHDGDESGVFSLELPAGPVRVEVIISGYEPFVQNEEVVKDVRRVVSYLVERSGRNPYEVIVTGDRVRTEISQTTLRGRDIKQVPGTFGDPFRVIQTLPGVSSVMSLLPFPVVRGSSPGNTGFLIDGVRVPLLFHLLAGPSVIHPEFIDEIEFSPGGFPVEYGGYTGGIVDGKTRSARPDEERVELDVNFFQAGLFVRQPIEALNLRATVAGRVGYPGVILSLASPRIGLNYWDYQARFDGGDKKSGYTLFVFGAYDGLSAIPDNLPDDAEKEPVLRFQFHRVDLRYHHETGPLAGNYQLTFGYDDSLSGENATLSSLSITPRLRWTLDVLPELDLRFGLDGLARQATFVPDEDGAGAIADLLGTDGEPTNVLYTGGALLEAFVKPWDDLVIRPGVRVDLYHDANTGHVGVDPRLMARYRLLQGGPDLWLKGGVGIYHQPPRFAVPIPGLDQIAFEQGLLRSVQTSVGAELRLAESWSIDVQTYVNYMDPIFFDFQINPNVEDILNQGPGGLPGELPTELPRDNDDLGDRLDQLLKAAVGRSYGMEVMLRRESATGLSGWLSYTLSRSERERDGRWVSFDFDRTHILNLVLGIPLPRRWQVGLRGQVQTGRPLTTTSGLSDARTGTFVRFDLRVDKTAVWNDWLLDFYVDVSNAVLAAEELAPEQQIRYVLATLGFRAMF